ncbi:HpcH/HpaI aldolase/citrate lyase family protein [Cellulosimicrobium cellulans J34]|nr:HpcH/HpaI aldolase/citrate lyase family protein [Cellulosimicrobium cellulans J34]SMF27849.1 HpcH/HpaI aldolase/citrate lyase family protein [Cellulosimicrobium cellulans J1]
MTAAPGAGRALGFDEDGVAALHATLDGLLAPWDTELEARYPGDDGSRQPVHTVYVPGDRYTAGLAPEWAARAREAVDAAGGGTDGVRRLVDLLGVGGGPVGDLADAVAERVRAKLAVEAIEDLRIDFEDGFGDRGDAAEDAAVTAAARELARAEAQGTATPFSGIRIKCLEAATRRRGVRTLALFVAELVAARAALLGADATAGLPDGFVVTLAKVTAPEQVEAMAVACERVEDANGLERGSLRFEVQVETPQALLAADGTATVARLVHAAPGRVTALHYGTYDYSASLGIAAAYQSMEHPAADHAKAVMQLAVAGTGVRLSDGSTNVLPVGDPQAVDAAWRLHGRLVRRSLERGYYQGWDLHPAQLPSRFAATYAFYREGAASALARLAAYVGFVPDAGGVLDEPATAKAMAWFLGRGVDCGALTEAEVRAATGLDRAGLDAVRVSGHAPQPVAG